MLGYRRTSFYISDFTFFICHLGLQLGVHALAGWLRWQQVEGEQQCQMENVKSKM
jgi:hypothetical protein